MKQSVKRALDTLQALDFNLDHEDRKLRHDRWIYTHPNAADQRLIVNWHMSDAAASKVIKHAEAIVGLAHTETDTAQTRAKRITADQKRAKAAEQQRLETTRRLAEQKAERTNLARQRQFAARQARGKLTDEDRLIVLADIRAPQIEPTRIADELCIRIQEVTAAINSGALEARMCHGKRILCDLAAVKQWVRAGCPIEDPLAS